MFPFCPLETTIANFQMFCLGHSGSLFRHRLLWPASLGEWQQYVYAERSPPRRSRKEGSKIPFIINDMDDLPEGRRAESRRGGGRPPPPAAGSGPAAP